MTVWTERRLANRDLNLAERELGRTVLHSRPPEVCLQLTENVDGTLPRHTMSEPLFDRVADLFATAETVDLRARGDGPILRRLPRFVARALESGCGIRLFCDPGMLDSALLRRLVRAEAVVTLTFDPDEALGTDAVLQDLKTLADGETPADPWRRLHVDHRGEVGVCDIAVVGDATTST